MSKARTFPREFKLDLMHQWDRGERRPSQLCREHRLTDATLHRWRREYLERGEAAFTTPDRLDAGVLQAQIVALERARDRLTLENNILKKAVTLARRPSDRP